LRTVDDIFILHPHGLQFEQSGPEVGALAVKQKVHYVGRAFFNQAQVHLNLLAKNLEVCPFMRGND
jgi:hypothetical protein